MLSSFDVALYPQFRPGPARYHVKAFGAFQTLSEALGYEQGQHVIPDATNASLIANGRFESRVTLPPQSYIWGFGCYSQRAEGFTTQIIDLGTGASFFASPERFEVLGGELPEPFGIDFPLSILPAPRLVLAPGVLSVRIVNQSSLANRIQFVIFTAQPPVEGIRKKNAANFMLDAEAALAARAIRGGFAPGVGGGPSGGSLPGGGSAPAQPQDLSQYIEIAAAGTHTVLPGFGSFAIAIYELQLYAPAGGDFTLWDGASRKLQGTLTGFPAGAGFYLPPSTRPHFRLTPGNSFVIETTGAAGGFVNYRME